MLKGIDPLLGPELLATLRAMGHGDEIAIVDGNYPADNHAKRLISCHGLDLVPTLRAVLSVFPLDDDWPQPAIRTCNTAHPDTPDEIHIEIDETLSSIVEEHRIEVTHGSNFYDRVKDCYAVVSTSEPALFANVILRKGALTQI